MLKPISQYIFLNRKVESDSIGTLCHWWWRVLILSSSISLAKHSKEIQVQYTLGLWPGAHSCFSRKWLTWSVNQSEHHDDLLTHRRNDFHITVGRGGISLLKVISIIFCFRANFGKNAWNIPARPWRYSKRCRSAYHLRTNKKKNERALEGDRTPEPWVLGRDRIDWAIRPTFRGVRYSKLLATTE